MAGYRIFMIMVKKMRAAYTWTTVLEVIAPLYIL
jgi:hypothetical protein